LFAGLAVLSLLRPGFAVPAACAGLAGVFTSVMVYVDTKRPFWSAPRVIGNFYGTTLFLGFVLGGLMLSVAGETNFSRATSGAALVVGLGLQFWRELSLTRARRDSSCAIHRNARVVAERLTGMTRLATAAAGCGLVLLGLAAFDFASLLPYWLAGAALLGLGGEIINRYQFFVASAATRMPGGVNS